MDFRVTHFLVGASAYNALSNETLENLSNGKIGAYLASDDATVASTANARNTGEKFYFAQGVDRTDAIQKELGLIKSGIIDISKIVSVRKMVGTDDYSRQLKFFGAGSTGVVVKAYANSTAYNAGDIIYSSSKLYLVVVAGSSSNTAPTSTTGLPVAMNTAKVAYIGTASAATQYSKMLPTGADGSATNGTLEFEGDKEYSFSVRVRSAKANSISPFGITRGYSAMAATTYVSTLTGAAATSDAYAPFSGLFGLVKNFSTDVLLSDFSKVGGVLSVSDGTDSSVFVFGYSDLALTVSAAAGIPANAISLNMSNLPSHLSLPAIKGNGGVFFIDVRKFATWSEALTACLTQTGTYSNPYPKQTTVVAGKSYTATLYTEALTQTTWKNNYDITAFPYKWDYVRMNGYFYAGPYASQYAWNSSSPINAGVTTQTPITYDSTQSGLISVGTIAINPITTDGDPIPAGYAVMTSAGVITTAIKFPNLLKEEVRHIAHQYQSYSAKYKQQFQGVRYNAMVVDPQQSKIDADGPYTLFYIEYLPSVDTSYTSTQQMTNMTIIAIPSSNNTLITNISDVLDNVTISVDTAG